MTTDFQVPRIISEKVDDRRGTFTIEPLDKGFGYTFGNSLRRVLLSSLGGAAITSVRIEGVAHEFSTVPGVKEDVTDIVLNLKDLVVRMHTDADEVEAPLVATGPGEVKAKDIDLPSGVEILNPEAPIATLEKKTKLEVYLTIGRGRGYSPAEENKSDEQPIGVIPIDSIFSPIRRASYAVAAARVGQRTDFDKLTLDLETDGSIEPAAALREASEILIKSLAIFTDAERVEELTAREPIPALPADPLSAPAGDGVASNNGLDEILIEELELGVRSYNCLKRAGVQTVGDLVRKSRAELNAIPNFGSEVDRGSDRDPARPRPRSPAGLRQRRERSGEPCAPPQEAEQAQPRRRAPRGAALEPLEAADRARADQDQPGQGQGGQARGRAADHAGQTRRPARPPPGAGDAAQRQVHRPQAVRRGGAALRDPARRLHPHRQARPAPLGLAPRWCTSSWFEPRLLPPRYRIRRLAASPAGPGSRVCARSRPSWRRRWRRSCASRSR